MARQFIKYLGKDIELPNKTSKQKQLEAEEINEDTSEMEIDLMTLPKTSVTATAQPMPPDNTPAPVVQQPHGIADNILESIIIMLNQIIQDLAAINQKLDSKASVESVQAIAMKPPTKRKIILHKDSNGKITGADVIDDIEGE